MGALPIVGEGSQGFRMSSSRSTTTACSRTLSDSSSCRPPTASTTMAVRPPSSSYTVASIGCDSRALSSTA
jgi:hypothetical protein